MNSSNDRKFVYSCTFANCSATYDSRKEQQVHIGSHYLKQICSVCKVCGASIRPQTYRVFRVHQMKVHKNSTYICPLTTCDYSSATLKSLKYHVFCQHGDDILESLDRTEGGVEDNATIRIEEPVYVAQNTSSTSLPYTCPVCYRGFAVEKSYRGHYFRMHTTPNEECDQCGERFHYPSQLASHMLLHFPQNECNVNVKAKPQLQRRPKSQKSRGELEQILWGKLLGFSTITEAGNLH